MEHLLQSWMVNLNDEEAINWHELAQLKFDSCSLGPQGRNKAKKQKETQQLPEIKREWPGTPPGCKNSLCFSSGGDGGGSRKPHKQEAPLQHIQCHTL